MVALAMIPLTCWVCAWLARPSKPLPGNEVQELAYGRLLGRHQRRLLALLLSGGLLLCSLIALPRRIDRTLRSVRGAHAACAHRPGNDGTHPGRDETASATVRCDELEAGGEWVEREYRRGIG
jgi:hypothetical protein